MSSNETEPGRAEVGRAGWARGGHTNGRELATEDSLLAMVVESSSWCVVKTWRL